MVDETPKVNQLHNRITYDTQTKLTLKARSFFYFPMELTIRRKV